MDLFIQEVRERSSEIENNLLAIEKTDAADSYKLQERLLRISHSLKGAAGLVEVRPVEAICHRMEDLLSLAVGEGRVIGRSELDLLLAATDAIAEAARALEKGDPLSGTSFQDVLRRLEAGIARKSETPASVAVSGRPAAAASAIGSADIDGSVRMSADRLDALLYRSGELIASRSRMSIRAKQALALRDQARGLRAATPISAKEASQIESGLRALADDLAVDDRLFDRAIAALDHEVRRARMQDFSEACKGLPRMVRDIALASGKTVDLHIFGGKIEIDRSILSGLRDSLRHLVRNAVGHGIEGPEDRRAAGKPVTGRIAISALLFGDSLEVRIEDDGKGFDADSIRKAAREAGLPDPQDENQLLRQAFEPGVSTSAAVTELSGRGVGLDIVKHSVERLRGSVEVSSVRGKSTTFILSLPLTLATVRALEVSAGGQDFAIDTASIRRVVRVPAQLLPAPGEPNIISINGASMRVIGLAGWLGLPADDDAAADTLPAVVIGPNGGETAVIVDDVGGEQELVARSLGARLANLRCYSGGTVLPDGRIALLLNATALAEAAALETSNETGIVVRPPATRKPRVLVVDDSLAIRMLEKLILQAAGFEVAMAADGAQAWQYLQTHEADAVIADIDMPAMDGLALTRAIRQSARFANLPVILVTGRDTSEDIAQGLDTGANAYVAKTGFDQQHFLETVRRVL